MKFKTVLLSGRLLRRYKRFLAEVELDSGEIVTAHCVNTGSMLGCKEEGAKVLLSEANYPHRKLKYTWEIVYVGKTPVCINTSTTNVIVAEAILQKKIPELALYSNLRREVKYGNNSRIDLLLEQEDGGSCFIEVKNVTLAEGKLALFPDAVTTRGQKHLEELIKVVEQGYRGVIFFLVQRNDVTGFAPAQGIDPEYAKKLKKAIENGVEVFVYKSKITREQITLGLKIPLLFSETTL